MTDQNILRNLGLMLARDEHGVAQPKPVRCAWCDAEAGVALDPKGPIVSHGICARHLAQTKADLEAQRRIAA